MKLETSRFLKTIEIQAAAGVAEFGEASEKFSLWLDSKPELPIHLKAFFKNYSPLNKGAWLGALNFNNEDQIIWMDEQLPKAIKSGLFIFGAAPNGDPIAVDFRDDPGAAGFISLEQMYAVDDLRSVYVKAAPSLGEFVERANDPNDDLPCDYWEALKRHEERPNGR